MYGNGLDQSLRHGGAIFTDRHDAGAQLAAVLAAREYDAPVVLAIPRGGVPVGAPIAEALHAPLDVIVARKLGAPWSPEYGIGAVTADGERWLDDSAIAMLRISPEYLATESRVQMAEAARREGRFRGGRPPADVSAHTVILVDDGLATGSTMRAALRSVRRRAPKRVVIAVPVGARDTVRALEREADAVICLQQPEPFEAVGLHYRRFAQTSDEEVEALLAAHAMGSG
jgi:predicted phosphoribosyltransferase